MNKHIFVWNRGLMLMELDDQNISPARPQIHVHWCTISHVYLCRCPFLEYLKLTIVNGGISRPVYLYINIQTHSSRERNPNFIADTCNTQKAPFTDKIFFKNHCSLLSASNCGDDMIMSFKEYERMSNTLGIANNNKKKQQNKKSSYMGGISHVKELKDKRERFWSLVQHMPYLFKK